MGHKDKGEVRKIKNRTAHFTLVDGVLYWRGYSTPLLRCVLFEEAHYILVEIHEGVCGNHLGGKALVGKVVRAGYY